MITGNVSKTFVYTLIVIACFKKIFIVCKKATTTTNTILLKFLFSLLPVVKILTFITGYCCCNCGTVKSVTSIIGNMHSYDF